MNRFRQKKKAKEDFVLDRPLVEPESSGPFKMFGRSKKSQDEPKRDVDLATALPPSDDFRTSLLMTGLSARFSMLREQDDPSSMLGKASDDSVLLPSKRQSRMDFAMNNNLGDIAEVESIHTPPYARMDSFNSSDDGASTNGSVMNRSKPIEGNNLFGGRQRIYKISANGTTRGRALYDDDVAQSAFQKWRQAEKEKEREKERSSFEENDNVPDSASLRPASPTSNDFSRRRETNSTTSSIAARNSTAATSVTSSQPAPSLKDWQPPSASATSSAPVQERTVSRTRRLYEQGLTQELQDQQSSALSRIDTLSKQRNFGQRTPDLTPGAPSPALSSNNLGERPFDRRPIKAKASAPNLRSFSPTTTIGSQSTPAESSSRFPGLEYKSSYTSSPPLSPPISETDEHPILSIGPNDRGKATAMGVFQRPQQYDETKFAQRQRQLQQGRDTPTTRARTGSNESAPTSRSRSSSSLNRTPFERADSGLVKTEPTVEEESSTHPVESAPPQVKIERPNDLDHPALKKTTAPAPLSLNKSADDVSSRLDRPRSATKKDVPDDSPTLGPGSGLSGMVRQHLRNDSNASSVYGAAPQDPEPDVHNDSHAAIDKAFEHLSVSSNPWDNQETTWDSPSRTNGVGQSETLLTSSTYKAEPSADEEQNQDEFAQHLAEGARRVRERLTTYVESDQSRSSSPARTHGDLKEELGNYRSNAFGTIRPRSSKGSLADREPSQTRARKIFGIGSSATTSPTQEKPSFDFHEGPRKKESFEARRAVGEHSPPAEKEENIHAGLKAFRQARRELQKMKESEARQRHQPTQYASPPPAGRAPPVSYNRIPSEESRGGPGYGPHPGSRPGSRTGSRPGSRAQRDRSESEASNGAPPHVRPGRIPYDEHHGQRSPSTGPRRPMASRSPGYPGPDQRQMPRMPGYDAPPPPLSRPDSSSSGPSPNMNINAPPLPPINPRRKNVGSPALRRQDDESSPSAHWPASSDRGLGSPATFLMSDDEETPGQYRPRVRTVNSDASVRGLKSRGAPMSPTHAPPRPPGSGSVMPGNNVPPGHMI